jgi:radical SAM protein with 4Fe4S-binding SPASM domain
MGKAISVRNPTLSHYALRREHFGGLQLDYTSASYKVLSEDEYRLLEYLLQQGDQYCQSWPVADAQAIRRLEEKGIVMSGPGGELTVPKIRRIPPPPFLPKVCLSAPLKVYDTYTRRCNLSCEHCYSSSDAKYSENRRTLEQTKMVMRKFYDVGTLEWRFTGGEPTVIHDLPDAIRAARHLGMMVSLNTNGCWGNRIAAQILESEVNEMVISLEGDESIHDRRRGSGTFLRVMRALGRITRDNRFTSGAGVRVVLNMTIGSDNVNRISFVVDLASSKGFDVNFVPLKMSGRASASLQGIMLSKEEYMEFAERVQELREDPAVQASGIKVGLKHKDLFCSDVADKSNLPCPLNGSECQALTTAIGLFVDGRVIACPFLMDEETYIGPNMLAVSVYEAWLSPAMERFRHAVKADCADCKFYTERCRGQCRAAVLLNGGIIRDGTLVGDDPYCFRDLMARVSKMA